MREDTLQQGLMQRRAPLRAFHRCFPAYFPYFLLTLTTGIQAWHEPEKTHDIGLIGPQEHVKTQEPEEREAAWGAGMSLLSTLFFLLTSLTNASPAPFCAQ